MAAYFLFSSGMSLRTWLAALLVAACGLVLGAVLRMLSIAGQLMFNTYRDLFETLRKHHKETLECNHDILAQCKAVVREHQMLNGAVEQCVCDIKDINQATHQIRAQLEHDLKNVEHDLKNAEQNIFQINDFLLKIKKHIEAQQ